MAGKPAKKAPVDAPAESVLARKVAAAVVPARETEEVQSPTRILRKSLVRAADLSLGIPVAALGISDETLTLDELIALCDSAHLLMTLRGRRSEFAGITGCDEGLASAVIEGATIGELSPSMAEARRPTDTDAALFAPLVDALITELQDRAPETPLARLAEGFSPRDRLPGAQAMAVQLADIRFRLLRITIDLGVGDRQGELLIAFPLDAASLAGPDAAPSPEADWQDTLYQQVMGSRARLTAELHRLSFPLTTLMRLKEGDVLPLIGATLDGVTLRSCDGRAVMNAMLGRMGDVRAVRIEERRQPGMEALDGGSLPEPEGYGADEVAAIAGDIDMGLEGDIAMGGADDFGADGAAEMGLDTETDLEQAGLADDPLAEALADAGEGLGDLPDLEGLDAAPAPLDDIDSASASDADIDALLAEAMGEGGDDADAGMMAAPIDLDGLPD